MKEKKYTEGFTLLLLNEIENHKSFKWCNAKYKKGYSAFSPAIQLRLAICVLLNLMAVCCLIRHRVPKSMDQNLCGSSRWSLFLTLRYKSGSSSENSPAVACKDLLRLPEARGDPGRSALHRGSSRSAARRESQLCSGDAEGWASPSCSRSSAGAAVWLGVCPCTSLQGSFTP